MNDEEKKLKRKAYKAEWYQKNKERLDKKSKEWRDAHPEVISARNKKFRDTHKEYFSEYYKAHKK